MDIIRYVHMDFPIPARRGGGVGMRLHAYMFEWGRKVCVGGEASIKYDTNRQVKLVRIISALY